MIWVKIGVVAVISIVFTFFHYLRVRSAKKRSALVGSGNICLHCDSSDVRVSFTGIDCNACGQSTSQALLDAKGPDEAELKEIFTPRHDR